MGIPYSVHAIVIDTYARTTFAVNRKSPEPDMCCGVLVARKFLSSGEKMKTWTKKKVKKNYNFMKRGKNNHTPAAPPHHEVMYLTGGKVMGSDDFTIVVIFRRFSNVIWWRLD